MIITEGNFWLGEVRPG